MALDEKEILTADEAVGEIRRLLKDLPVAFMITVNGSEITGRPIGVVGDGHARRFRLVAAFAKSVLTGDPGASGNAGTALLDGR